MTKSADDIRKNITEMMVKAINEGVPPWRKPWSASPNSGSPCNFVSGRRYTGINPLILMYWSLGFNYSSKFWGSSSAWLKNIGAHVMREQHAVAITLFRMMPKRDPKTKQIMKNGKGEDILFPMLREFPIFNAEQLQAPTVETLLGGGGIVQTMLGHKGRKDKSATSKDDLLKIALQYLPRKSQPKKTWTREKIAGAIHEQIKVRLDGYLVVLQDLNSEPDFDPAEQFIKSTKANIRYAGDRAYLDVMNDLVVVPEKRKFLSMADFYETVFHELVHWTQRADRVGVKVQEAGVDSYAFNELVAEIGACLLLIELGVPMADKMMDKSKAYVKNWLLRMSNDPKFIFDAAAQAGKAVDFLLGFVGRQNPVYEEQDESATHLDRAVA